MTEPRSPLPPDEEQLQQEAEALGRLYRQTRATPPPELRALVEAEVDRALAIDPARSKKTRRPRPFAPVWALAASLSFVALLFGVLRSPTPNHDTDVALSTDAPELADLLRQRGGPTPFTGGEYLGESDVRLSLAPQPGGGFAIRLATPSGDVLGGQAQRRGAELTLEAGTPEQPCRLELTPEGRDLRLRSEGCAGTAAAQTALDGRFSLRVTGP